MPEILPRGHARRRSKHLGRWISTVIVLLVIGGLTANYMRPLPLVSSHRLALPSLPAKNVSIAWPDTGQAAIGALGYGLLDSHNDTTPAATASIAKLITVLCVLQKYPLSVGQNGPTITLDQSDVERYTDYLAKDGSVVQVASGEQISEYQMLQGILLPSGNNLADSLAVWAFGSLDDYKAFATQFLADNGLSNTHIGSDASGYDPDTLATASDLVHLANLVMGQPALAGIVSQESAILPVAGTVYNYNFMLGTDGINGIKTGNNDVDLGAFVFSAEITVGNAPITVVGAIMNQPSLSVALRAAGPLVASLQAGFQQTTIATAGQKLASYTAPWGATTAAVAGKTSKAVRWLGTSGKTSLTASDISPGQKDKTVGSLVFDTGGIRAASPVSLKNPLPGPSLWWRLTRH